MKSEIKSGQSGRHFRLSAFGLKLFDLLRTWRLRARARRLYGEWKFPCLICLEISSPCNRSCHYCANAMGYQSKRAMSFSTLWTALKQLRDMQWRGDVCFNYLNEAMLDKRLPEFTRALTQILPRCRTVIFTNGDFMNVASVSELIAAGQDLFFVTRHPPYKPEWDAKIAFLARRFPRHIRVREIDGNPWLMTWAGRTPMKGLTNYYETGCPVVQGGITVLADGRVQMCCCDALQENVVGNIHNQSILEIWQSENYRALRDQAISGEPTNETCKRCYEARL